VVSKKYAPKEGEVSAGQKGSSVVVAKPSFGIVKLTV
jgi:hypothetical protein